MTTTEQATTVDEVIQRMREIDAALEPADGIACFNRMYLKVTELVKQNLTEGFFADNAFVERMDVIFANLYLANIDADAAGRAVNAAWRPLFDARSNRTIWPVQFALAGMNAHINHDLALSVIDTCVERHTTPDTPPVHDDYQKVNDLLASAEAEVRAEFEPQIVRVPTESAEPLKHIVSSFSIETARNTAWGTVQSLWPQRNSPLTYRPATAALAQNTGLASTLLLTPVIPPPAD
jgi:hypothetical protein